MRRGEPGTLRLLLVFGLAFAAVGVRECGLRPGMTVMAASLVLLVIALPGQQRLWGRLHGFSDGSLLVAEDATGVVAFTATDVGLWLIFVNGKSNSELPFSGEHTLLGALPALIHLEPADVAIVGLGSGNTAWAAGCRPETRRVTVFEIAAPQLRLLRVFEEARPTPKLRRFLDDPRVRVRVADGRNALERDGALYDFIEADALRPWTAYSGNLYSEEFFVRAARRLKPGGVMCTWAPTPRIYATFCTVFPHVVDFGSIVVGSRQPLHMELDVWTSRLRSPEVTSYLGPFLANQVLKSLKRARLADRLAYERTDTNRDLFPRDEFMTP